MKLGFGLPNIGPAAGPEGIIKVAQQAEELGFDSVWVIDRLLFALEPQTSYMGGPWPEVYKIALDPLHALTFAAAHTSRLGLGTSILVMPYYNPVLLARSLTALDVLSGGRLQVSFGQGWAKDEFDAAGVPMEDRAARADEFMEVLKAIWTADTVEFKGKFFEVPKSVIEPKPVQKPHPPIYMAAFSPGSMERTATTANGWNPVGVPASGMAQMMAGIRQMAEKAGRDPAELKMLVRANINLTDQPLGEDRWIYNGSKEQVKNDIQATREAGADEIIFDPVFSPAGATVEGFLSTMKQVKALAAA